MTAGQRGWLRKFVVAFAGVGWAMRTQNSFYVHLTVAAGVLALGGLLRIGLWQWSALTIAICLVLTLELVNSSIEQLVKVLHPERNETIGRALDVAAGAVLIASFGAAVVGLITLGPPLWTWLWQWLP